MLCFILVANMYGGVPTPLAVLHHIQGDVSRGKCLRRDDAGALLSNCYRNSSRLPPLREAIQGSGSRSGSGSVSGHVNHPENGFGSAENEPLLPDPKLGHGYQVGDILWCFAVNVCTISLLNANYYLCVLYFTATHEDPWTIH